MISKKVFVVDFKCHNCWHTWVEDFGAGDRIENAGLGRNPYLFSADCTHTFACKNCRDIDCPICESDKDVTVTGRHTIEGAMAVANSEGSKGNGQ